MSHDTLKKELLQSKQELEERLQKIKKHIQRTDIEIDPDFEEQAIQRQNDEVVDELSGSLQRKLSEVRLALQRMEEGNYGICASCGEPISEERLKAIPHATLCRNCME